MSTHDDELDPDAFGAEDEHLFNESDSDDEKLPLDDDELGDDEFGPAEDDDDFEDDFSFGDDE